jgi:hypothetical protein
VLHYRATAAASSSHTCRLLRSLEAPALLSFFLSFFEALLSFLLEGVSL